MALQRWEKLGAVRLTTGQPLVQATVPTIQEFDGWRARLLYGALDPGMVARVQMVEIDLREPTVALTPPRQLLQIGEPGQFDDNGVVPIQVLTHGGRTLLLYAGFQKQIEVPYTILAGMAGSDDGGVTYGRQLAPLLERSLEEPHVRTAPRILRVGDGWRLWYIAATGWISHGDKQLPTYDLRSATSGDIGRWPASGQVVMQPVGDEIGFGRPYPVHEDGGYRMWYSVRRRTGYRLGYAESADGVDWRRLDEQLDLGRPVPGFDDEMTCYAAVTRRADGARVMFYNGNGYGRAGIGAALLRS
ncbi:MAG: glucosyl hydrolase [Chloroflexota bacterium]